MKAKRLFVRNFFKLILPFVRVYWFVFRPKTRGVKCVIENDGKYLFIRNNYGRGMWTFPGGGVKNDESFKDAAERECFEEVGIKLNNIEEIGFLENRREYKRDMIYCFYSKVENNNFIIDPIEIREARWFDLDNLPRSLSYLVEEIISLMKKRKPLS
ncbi:MAG: hypothetical protein COU07_02240 [Candidatus Harrisonbacteria bacterium CG10_big_fil_rev_8_21_14_0_10_40_38]|uniref:Nudix hydrolase domain-containing protein n=1 Tax=Candidatus Harrisonbacteria bacterium CG10_big_fil_rev_8_21_14_0_10_40_38 TaxID=1974583 RepID=A0A2H0US68_9BACT|nr:MAG: hypothetical protein COU07_02240 [Candidatus Harrisonbacteria bacterium CG10_big_fil_rev_8_21_14_0_10_40_38]